VLLVTQICGYVNKQENIKMIRIILLALFGLMLATSNLVFSAPSEHCTTEAYGTSADRRTIEDAMFEGTQQAVESAINNAKETRGATVGCRTDPWDYAASNTTPPSFAQLEELWNNVHMPALSGYGYNCASLGRSWPANALGGLYGKLAGYNSSMEVIRTIADQGEASQYSSSHASEPLVTYPGLFGYSTLLTDRNSVCFKGDPDNPNDSVVVAQINAWCSAKPSVCVTYNSGLWAGQKFLVEDFSLNPREYGGAAAYDHAWSTVLAVELWLQESDPILKTKYEASTKLAADWSASEPSVRNHNYTAKNIWVLAQVYQLTGDLNYKNALEDKLNRNLKTGVLMDLDNNGLVDGMINQPFSSLASYAQLPGRMWDGHNSNPWYQSMNALAAVEAYVAFRDSGDVTNAADIRPYAIAMLDNLATELVSKGLPVPDGEHMWPIPYSLLTALWKVSAVENEPRPLWENAVATLFNRGIYNTADTSSDNTTGRATASLALYMLYLSDTPYQPLNQRLTPPLTGASNPLPAELSTNVSVESDLSWSAGDGAISYDVYFGTNPTLDASTFLGNQTTTSAALATLLNDTTYYWRVDAVSANNTITGDVWSFTTEQAVIEPTVLLDEGFESGSFADGGWVTNWSINNTEPRTGIYTAYCGSRDRNLISKKFDLTSYSKLTISFYYRDTKIDNSDNVYFQAHNGSNYESVFELGNSLPENTWHYFTVTVRNSGNDAKFFHSNFQFKFAGTGIDSNEALRIDDVKLIVE